MRTAIVISFSLFVRSGFLHRVLTRTTHLVSMVEQTLSMVLPQRGAAGA
jgi:hypothetical protein